MPLREIFEPRIDGETNIPFRNFFNASPTPPPTPSLRSGQAPPPILPFRGHVRIGRGEKKKGEWVRANTE